MVKTLERKLNPQVFVEDFVCSTREVRFVNS